MLRLLAAKFSKSVRVPADKVEWMLADTERVEPEKGYNQAIISWIIFLFTCNPILNANLNLIRNVHKICLIKLSPVLSDSWEVFIRSECL